jgi:effector-binding domain-containing protein
VMPAGIKRDDTPDPPDSRVRIVTLSERDIAVIRFSGYAPPEDVDAAALGLPVRLRNEGIVTAGQPFLMRYDSPWTPGFLRRNEVGIEIRR